VKEMTVVATEETSAAQVAAAVLRLSAVTVLQQRAAQAGLARLPRFQAAASHGQEVVAVGVRAALLAVQRGVVVRERVARPEQMQTPTPGLVEAVHAKVVEAPAATEARAW
jgi:hypothetical protein